MTMKGDTPITTRGWMRHVGGNPCATKQNNHSKNQITMKNNEQNTNE